jgi:hypothetical protein
MPGETPGMVRNLETHFQNETLMLRYAYLPRIFLS